MVAIERLVATQNLKTAQLVTMLDYGHGGYMYYDNESDTLLLVVVPPTTETVVHYIDEHMALLYEPDSREVVGFQVEAFQHSFLVQHASLQGVWRLSDAGIELKDLEDLIVVFEHKKQKVARELTIITEGLLGPPSIFHQPAQALMPA